jgi:hypothetical protein
VGFNTKSSSLSSSNRVTTTFGSSQNLATKFSNKKDTGELDFQQRYMFKSNSTIKKKTSSKTKSKKHRVSVSSSDITKANPTVNVNRKSFIE